jgi:hypothetical protein
MSDLQMQIPACLSLLAWFTSRRRHFVPDLVEGISPSLIAEPLGARPSAHVGGVPIRVPARIVGSADFGEAVSRYLTREFEGFGGTARIIVSTKLIQVTWNPDTDTADPIQIAMEKLSRGLFPQAIQLLELFLSQSPNDPDILLNLGMALLKGERTAEAEAILRCAVSIIPSDQRAWIGLAEALFVQNRLDDADEFYRTAIEIDDSSRIAELARGRLSEIANTKSLSKTPGVERMDAVMYLLGAIEKFEGMSRMEVEKIGFEVAKLGMNGFDVNESDEKYQLQSLPGRFSGLHMVCLMYAAFKIFNPTADIGFDLADEYAAAQQMKRDRRRLWVCCRSGADHAIKLILVSERPLQVPSRSIPGQCNGWKQRRKNLHRCRLNEQR